jgi:hypothetical protein
VTAYDLFALLALPLGVLTYFSLVTTAVLGLLMTRRKVRLPVHKAAARTAVVVGTLHGLTVLLTMLL